MRQRPVLRTGGTRRKLALDHRCRLRCDRSQLPRDKGCRQFLYPGWVSMTPVCPAVQNCVVCKEDTRRRFSQEKANYLGSGYKLNLYHMNCIFTSVSVFQWHMRLRGAVCCRSMRPGVGLIRVVALSLLVLPSARRNRRSQSRFRRRNATKPGIPECAIVMRDRCRSYPAEWRYYRRKSCYLDPDTGTNLPERVA